MAPTVSYLLIALACLMTRSNQAIAVRDCLQCWREVCTKGTLTLDTSFRDDCCTSDCLGSDQAQCFIIATTAHNSSDCCTIAETNLLADLPSNSDVCQISESNVFNTPGQTPTNSLQGGIYVVPRFMFNCSGCIEEVEVQGIGHFSGNSITMMFMTWTRINDRELYRLRNSVTATTTDIDLDGSIGGVDIKFSFSENDQLCFENNEELGLSLAVTNLIKVNIDLVEDDSEVVYELIPSTSGTCSNLNDIYEISPTSINGMPLVTVHTRPLPELPTSTAIFISSPSVTVHTRPLPVPNPPTTYPSSSRRMVSTYVAIPPLSTTTTTVLHTSTQPCIQPFSAYFNSTLHSMWPCMTLSPSTQVHSTDEDDTTLYVIIGVSGAVVVVLIATAVFVVLISLSKWRNKLRSTVNIIENTAYGVSQNVMNLSSNVAYSAINSASFQGEDTYDYISTSDENDIITTSPNEAYATTNAVTGNVPVSSNQAYGMVHH